jgi:hypothetical protein
MILFGGPFNVWLESSRRDFSNITKCVKNGGSVLPMTLFFLSHAKSASFTPLNLKFHLLAIEFS